MKVDIIRAVCKCHLLYAKCLMDHFEVTAPQNDSKDTAEPRSPVETVKKEEKQKEKEKKYSSISRYYFQAIQVYHRTLKKLQVLLSILCNRDLMSHYSHSPQMKKTDAAMMLLVVYTNLTYCYNMTDCIEEVVFSMNEVQSIVDAYFFDNHELKVAIGRMNDYVVKRVTASHHSSARSSKPFSRSVASSSISSSTSGVLSMTCSLPLLNSSFRTVWITSTKSASSTRPRISGSSLSSRSMVEKSCDPQ